VRKLLVALLMVIGCQTSPPAPAGGLPDRDPALARKLAAEGAVVLDVRSPEEFAGGHAPNAINIPVGELEGRLAEVGSDKQKPIVVYCGAGVRAGKAKEKLLSAGYTQVTNLGGLSDWNK